METDLDIPNLLPTQYYTDSRDVLAWITNDSTKEVLKRYVTSRIDTIRKISNPNQWYYIPTADNPADIGTRPISVKNLQASDWLKGPSFLSSNNPHLIPPKTIQTSPTYQSSATEVSNYFITKHRHATEDITSGAMWDSYLQSCQKENDFPNLLETSVALQRKMQKEVWPKGIESIKQLHPKRRDEILSKSPFMDPSDGLIKVGGRLQRSDLSFGRKHPTLIPDTELGDALLGSIHAKTEHQGRKISSSSIREAGYFPIGGRRRVDRIIASCVLCRTLRAPTMSQKMADLPEQRLFRTPPFYHCGIDVFGHFNIRYGKQTRASPGTQKIWVLLFSCLYSRAIHLEMLESMDTASFKLAFNRFQSLRGDCAYLRSDAGSNFMGARNEEHNEETHVPNEVINEVRSNWEQQGKIWDVNPPTASHFGGVWERAIGQIRHVIEGYLLPQTQSLLRKEEFHTLLLHAARIVNSTPLHEVPESPNESQPIPPHHLITQLDDTCNEKYSRPTNYLHDDLLTYVVNRWKRVEKSC